METMDMDVGNIRSVNINEEMRGSYLDYAMSVIVARALPDARDGLKPVHRRILYAMYDMGIRSNSAYKKSARIVGDVLGKYHPHGDSAVYDAMARMAQDFSLRYPLVDGQGNFGSVDGDSPAAMRYTEARLAKLAEELLTDLDMETVDFIDNYDGSTQEPSVLPARLPNLLLNGTSGIAVGMATSIPPHNLRELTQAIIYLIDNYYRVEDITVDELMEFVHGPDFPTGATVVVGDELKEAYATGRGRVVMRAKSTVEEGKNGRYHIIFTEIPYQVSKVVIIERIVELVREGRLQGIADLRDESDRNGMRLVVELKFGAQPLTVLNQLYKYTQLQSTFSIQMLALVNNEPRNLSLRRALQIYVEHRYEVIVRRSEFELRKQRARAHILEGLLKALSSLDAIIQTIRSAENVDVARASLMSRFDLSEAQSNAILEMQLRRLAALERLKIQNEYNEVMSRIAYLEDLLASPEKILAVIREDVTDLDETYGDGRRTDILYGVSTDFDEADLVREEEVIVSLTDRGYIKRVPSSAYRAQRRGGKGVIGMTTKEEDTLLDIFAANSLDYLLFFSDKGKVYSERAFRVPETQRASKGTLIHTILNLEPDEHITAVLPVSSFEDQSGYFVLTTRRGRIKRVAVEEFAAVRPSGLIAMGLEPDDYLGWVKYSDGDQDIIIVTEQGQSIRFHESGVRVMGRPAVGVNAIKLELDDFIAGMDVVDMAHSHMLVVTRNGYGKRTLLSDYRQQGRYGAGIRTLARNDKTGPIIAMRCINASDDIMFITKFGVVLRTNLTQIRETGRSTQGVKLMDLYEGDEVVAVAIMSGANTDAAISAAAEQNGAYAQNGASEADGAVSQNGAVDPDELPPPEDMSE
jgi:DNA gyrase subunit A